MKTLVIGGAAEVWDEVAETERLFGREWWDEVIAVNDVGCHWKRHLDAWCTLHPEKMAGWIQLRERLGNPGGYETYTINRRGKCGCDHAISYPLGGSGGSSGRLGVAVALHRGGVRTTRIILCGVPMSRSGYFEGSTVHPPGRTFSSAHSHWKKWRADAPKLDGKVKSMGGRTQAMFGAPTQEWLNGE